MEADRVERKLSAILAADVAGYSRLMGADDEGTLASFNRHRRELIDPCIAKHRGRIVKTTGDGLLAEFASVVDAVRCAVEVQDGMAERNADVAADEAARIPDRHQFRRHRRTGRRHLRRRGQHRRATGGDRRAGRDLRFGTRARRCGGKDRRCALRISASRR